jgi:hypothetical protein
MALPGGEILAGFKSTPSSTAAASLGIVHLDANGQVVREVMLGDHVALRPHPRMGERASLDERLIAALVDVTVAGGPPRAVAVVAGGCVDTNYYCSFLHIFDPTTLAPIETQEVPTPTLPRTAYRDGNELVIVYDSPDVVELHPLPLVIGGPKASLSAVERIGSTTGTFASRQRGFWLAGSTHDGGHFGGIRFHTERGSSLMVLGARSQANPFGIGAVGERVFAFFTQGGADRRTWMAEIPVEREPPAVLGRSIEIERGVVGRVRTDALGQMWALVPERGVIMRISVP